MVFISTLPSSSRETVLSSKLSFGHHFMSSVDHSTADAMKPSISKGYHLRSVNSSLVNLYLTPAFPTLPPSCVTLSSRLSAGPCPFIKAQPTCVHHIYNTYTNACLYILIQDTDFHVCLVVLLFFFWKCPGIYFMLRQWKKELAASVARGCVH